MTKRNPTPYSYGANHAMYIRLAKARGVTNQRILLTVIGKRMSDARYMLGVTQEKAAERLKCCPIMLANIERGTDLKRIPLWLIERASWVYEVSLDYLFGVTDDFERSPQACAERNFHQFVIDEIERARLEEVAILGKLRRKIYATDSAMSEVYEYAQKVAEAVEVFKKNQKFDGMAGSNKLLTYSRKLQERVELANLQLKAFRAGCTVSKYERILLGAAEDSDGQ